jgi:glutamate--glyoxylate aminotransferase
MSFLAHRGVSRQLASVAQTIGRVRTLAQKAITVDTMNPHMRECKYEVRGEIYLASLKRVQEGKEVIPLNIGNPQSLGQLPMTYNRQVMSLLIAPFLLDDPNVSKLFPTDVIERAKLYLKNTKGGLGAYSDSKGVPYIRQLVANFIQSKTGQVSNPDNIFLSNGASECAKLVLNALIRGKSDGIMVPIPQYPLYSASIALFGGELVPYYLNEDGGWALDIAALQSSIDASRTKGVLVRALVFINPGNPTGQCLSKKNLQDLIKFCYDNRLILCADEVYQENIYAPNKSFESARKVLGEMPEPYKSTVELVSFHSTSKGFIGECGLRGGYMELHNILPDVVDELYKISSVNLCPNLPGQFATALMVNPPQPGDQSHALFEQEKSDRIESLKRRARMLSEAFNRLDGMSCQATEGAMYAFPRISVPAKAVEEARRVGKQPDVLYCLELLNETGLCCVPGSGFQQEPGTFHFRTTILPAEEKFPEIIRKFSEFHQKFMK